MAGRWATGSTAALSRRNSMTVARWCAQAQDRGVTPFSLYIHIPYCDSKCPYCDFNSYAAKRWPEADYCAALIRELEAYAEEPTWREGELRSVFFGGGTPSLFDPGSIGGLLAAVSRLWPDRGEPVEITLEANPGTVDRAKLAGFRAAGINRISFGVQSFHPQHLERLGRIHSAAQAIAAIGLAREAGFTNLNFDLIFAVPDQTVEEWEADLEMAVALAPDHISAYSLTYEDGTAFGAQRRSGQIAPVPEEVEVAMFTGTQVRLAEAGFAQYEISNYARPGRECRHNLNYWRTGPYLGVGAGAHAFGIAPTPGRRWSNEKSPPRYLERVGADGHARVTEELLTVEQARGEFVFLGLRCRDGFDGAAFAARFDADFCAAFPHAATFVRDGFLESSAGRWRLTDRGLLFADSIFATFL